MTFAMAATPRSYGPVAVSPLGASTCAQLKIMCASSTPGCQRTMSLRKWITPYGSNEPPVDMEVRVRGFAAPAANGVALYFMAWQTTVGLDADLACDLATPVRRKAHLTGYIANSGSSNASSVEVVRGQRASGA